MKTYILKIVELKSLCNLNVVFEVTMLELIGWIIFDKYELGFLALLNGDNTCRFIGV